MTDSTHDPALRSWVDGSNDPATDFPIQNLPLGIGGGHRAVCVAIGDYALDLSACAQAGMLPPSLAELVNECGVRGTLNALMAEGRATARQLRQELVALLAADNSAAKKRASEFLVPLTEMKFHLPAAVGDFSDFYASLHHARNVGSMFRPDNPLLPNYKHVPIGYHGRASSVVVSGTAIRRPSGQRRDDPNAPPAFGPTAKLDYEMEVGVFVGPGNQLGEPIRISDADSHLWGLCLLNDWSARDIQSWEYQPLGPFLAKSFATSVSPWVVTLDAMEPFRVEARRRGADDPPPLPYLADGRDQQRGGIALNVEVWLRSDAMRRSGAEPVRVSRANFRDLYWTIAQLLTHHASNGCNLRPGDLLGSGTVSGATQESRGCLLERTWRGSEPLELPTGERRSFLEDGDEVVMRGFAEAPGFRRVGMGECRGVVTAATSVRS